MLEKGRGDTPLTYFEYGTLGALAIFKRHAVDYVLLEVGLGGRYDATNIVNPYACVITTIDLDHKEYLGDTRELVGYDKAGIFRTNTPAIVGDLAIPHTVTDYGNEINADMVLSGRDFKFTEDSEGFNWQYKANDWRLAKPAIPCQNAATALTLLSKLDLLPNEQQVRDCLANLTVEGRFQQLSEQPLIFTDVAHNPESARYLARKLSVYKDQGFKIHALVAMLADKDKVAAMSAVADVVDEWSLASLDCFRGDTVENLASALAETPSTAPSTHYKSVEAALDAMLPKLDKSTLLIVFGSFITVAAAINYFKE